MVPPWALAVLTGCPASRKLTHAAAQNLKWSEAMILQLRFYGRNYLWKLRAMKLSAAFVSGQQVSNPPRDEREIQFQPPEPEQ